jgi:8-oxo-dGTP pyrophosphatase MutT (NUDIX family)
MTHPVFDPRLVPVDAVDRHLPAIDRAELQAAALVRRFAHPPQWQSELPGDQSAAPGAELRHAAVLVPIVLRPEPTVLLTVRTAHLTSHSGQVALPGGRQDEHDANEVATALREAQEEVGLHPQFVSVLGCLPLYVTGTGYKVTPVVALIDPAMQLTANPHEVADVFEVPLAHLMDPANHRRHALEWQGVQRQWISMPYDASQSERLIWGATAGILRHLYDFLQAPL